MIVTAILGLVIVRYMGPLWIGPVAASLLLLFLLFRDPGRSVPPLPLAAVAPIDGRVVAVGQESGKLLPGAWRRISIRTNHFGAYTVRSPIEGAILSIREAAGPEYSVRTPAGLWVRNEEQDDVVLLFPSNGWGPAPKAFVRYGERVGQGQRFAYLRLAPRAEVYLPVTAQIRVQKGDRVCAGSTVLADLAEE